MQSYLTINQLHLSFAKQPPLFCDLSFQFPTQQWTSILGRSGIGKSCLLRAIAGLYDRNNVNITGNITYQQHPIETGQVSYLSQQSSLLPWLSVIDNVVINYRLRGTFTKAIYNKAEKLLGQVGLGNDKHKRPGNLSGGMKQRVELARVLIDDTPIVLLDEPFSALDHITRLSMQTLSYELLHKKTVILVTHDPLEALRLSDQLLILSGTPAELSSPIHVDHPPLRSLNDPILLQQQAELLTALSRQSDVV